MSVPDGIELDNSFEIFIPTQCICGQLLDEKLREEALLSAEGQFYEWFGGATISSKTGVWKLPDGSMADEKVDIVESLASEDAFEDHLDDAKRLAVQIADKLSQDKVLLKVNGRGILFSRSDETVECGHAGVVKSADTTPEVDALLDPVSVYYSLAGFSSVRHARQLFCNVLNYKVASTDLPNAGWPESVRSHLKDSPEVIADTNGFKIVHIHLATDGLRRGAERQIVQRIYQDDPTFRGLFVVSDNEQKSWEFINVKLASEGSKKFLLRRMRVGVPGVRTATERILKVAIDEGQESTIDAATIQKLHDQAFDVESVTKLFYREIADWYFWAQQHQGITYPRSINGEELQSIFLIRLLTRLIFCWFLREKCLIPNEYFSREKASKLLKDFSPEVGTYYKAFLQNLFFATLNQEQDKRGFRRKYDSSRDGNRGATNLYRYTDLLSDQDDLLELLKKVPFVNGGLFDCLDQVFSKSEGKKNVRLDDFSEEKGNDLCIPNELFFGIERKVDLSEIYGDKKYKKETVRGLLDILSRYNFTVEENTPFEQEVALDPEMLGRVFENLLASFNKDTQTTARKATGSFYTPREVVSYMVDESLKLYLEETISKAPSFASTNQEELKKRIDALFLQTEDFENTFDEKETKTLIAAIDNVKILDPACGSGAFPMGALHRLVDLLQKLDPNNWEWKTRQLAKAQHDLKLAKQMKEEKIREAAVADVEARIADIERSFDTHFHDLDFARKLYLIENCIFGVDIQPIACQIAKLRFFIALIVDQKVDISAPNCGVLALPNLETKIVAADSLTPIVRPQQQMDLLEMQIQDLRQRLEQVRHEYFTARTPAKKATCRQKDAQLRAEIADCLSQSGFPSETARMLAEWDPYDQNAHADFFDPEWMFGLPVGKVVVNAQSPSTMLGHLSLVNDLPGQMELAANAEEKESGFDVVIGNPPYVRQEEIKHLKEGLKKFYDCFTGTADLYVYFYERSIKLLKPHGVFSFITSNKWYRAKYGEKLRDWLKRNTHLKSIIDFGDENVFTAIAYPTIVLATRREQALREIDVNSKLLDETLLALNWRHETSVNDISSVFYRESFSVPQNALAQEGWQLESPTKRKLLADIKASGTPLGEYVNGRFYRGILTGLNEAFVINGEVRNRLIQDDPNSTEIIKPFLRGKDVKRWGVDHQDLWLIFTRRPFDIDKYPAIKKHLVKYKTKLTPKPRDWDEDQKGKWPGRKAGSYSWYEIQDNIAYWQEFEQPKIIVPAIAESPWFAPDRKKFYSNNKTSIYVTNEVEFLLGCLNSCVNSWFSTQVCATKQNNYYDFEPRYSSQLIIPNANNIQKEIIKTFVDARIIFNDPRFDLIIDGLVCELFFARDINHLKIYLFDEVKDLCSKLTDLLRSKNTKKSAFNDLLDLHFGDSCKLNISLKTVNKIEAIRLVKDKAD